MYTRLPVSNTIINLYLFGSFIRDSHVGAYHRFPNRLRLSGHTGRSFTFAEGPAHLLMGKELQLQRSKLSPFITVCVEHVSLSRFEVFTHRIEILSRT
jgi:hypothetical protein